MWIKLAEKQETADKNKLFQLACRRGYSKVAELLLQKSIELKIDISAKDRLDFTAFHYACKNGHSNLAQKMIQKSTELNIELNAITKFDETALFILPVSMVI